MKMAPIEISTIVDFQRLWLWNFTPWRELILTHHLIIRRLIKFELVRASPKFWNFHGLGSVQSKVLDVHDQKFINSYSVRSLKFRIQRSWCVDARWFLGGRLWASKEILFPVLLLEFQNYIHHWWHVTPRLIVWHKMILSESDITWVLRMKLNQSGDSNQPMKRRYLRVSLYM